MIEEDPRSDGRKKSTMSSITSSQSKDGSGQTEDEPATSPSKHASPPTPADQIGDKVENHVVEYKEYRERWFILLAITSLIWTNITQWVSFSAQIDQTNMFFCGTVHNCYAAFLSNQIYQIVAIIVSIAGMYFATIFGTLPTLRLSAILNIVGALIRLVSSLPILKNFIWRQILMLTGTSIAAAGQVYFVVFSKVAESWFFPKHRASATVACTNSLQLGVVLGTVLPSIIIPAKFTEAIANSWEFFWLNTTITVVCLIPLFLLFTLCHRSVPKTPPSPSSQHETNGPVTSGILSCLKDRQFLIQIAVYSINFSIANGLIYTSNAINYRGYNLMGYPIAIATLVCIFSAYFVGIVADRTRKFKTIALINALVAAVSVVALRLYLIKAYSGWYDSVIVCALLSITMSCCAIHVPIGNEMAVETTYPIQESISTGVLNTFGQAWLFSLYFIMTALQKSDWIYKNSGEGGSWELALDFWAAIAILNSIIAIFFLNPRYNRLKMEEDACKN